ncbi:DUF2207 domain-containing protein [Aeromicrobium sp.]|nr:DUF2207 domain-containing protein [Candidatus Saccharibacteria bacterium]
MKLRNGILGFVLSVVLASSMVSSVAADANNFTIDTFAADYTLGQDDPQGTLTIQEQITITFAGYNHGIFRAIPTKYNSMPQHVQVKAVTRDGVPENYTTSTSNDNKVIKIGDADRTITGVHRYNIEYKVQNVIRFVGDTAQLDWNVNGTEWQQKATAVTAQLHVPSSLAGRLTDEKCFTGLVRSSSSDCIVASNNGNTTFASTRPLNGGETLTLNSTIPAGYFSKPGIADYWNDYARQILSAIAAPLAALMLAGGVWYRKGRDAKGRGTIIPEYKPPDGLKPADLDVILHNKLGKNAVSATIIDLAIRKYLRIQESKSDGILGLGKRAIYTLILLPQPPNDTLAPHETVILEGIFKTAAPAMDLADIQAAMKAHPTASGILAGPLAKFRKTTVDSKATIDQPALAGKEVEISSLKSSFSKTLTKVQKMLPEALTTQGYFTSNPDKAGNIWFVIAVALFLVAFYGFNAIGIVFTISLVVSASIVFIFAVLMPSRTAKGAAAKDAAEGLRVYLNTAEKDRIAMLQSPSAPYAPQSAEPSKTVELFEKLLPYAMVLGVEQQWARQFESIYTTPPDWYSGNWSTFSVVHLASSLASSVDAMNSSFAAPASASSGFSGGAGGGGGGGGGGGW